MATAAQTEPKSPYRRLTDLAERALPASFLLLVQRLGVAAVFFQSGRTKVEGLFTIPETTVELFRSEYALPLLPPEVAATLAAGAEHLFPVLLVLGLFTRLSAAALLGMTLVIQVFVYPNAFATHGLWAALMLYLMARGAGVVSLDHLLARRARS